ncbi:MAG: HAD family hydrolase [Elusimicrobiales bacterium]|nr:HAD family hydrolase [Elusimicrobiales bacterium]
MKTVFFDFGGTLDSNALPWREIFYSIYKSEFKNLDEEKFSKAFFDSDDNLHLRHDLSKAGLEKTVEFQVSDVFKHLKIENKSAEERIINSFISNSRKYFQISKSVLENLKSKNLKLGVISNFYGNLKPILKGENLLQYFDVVADSGQIGFIKPDRAIFEWALKKADTTAQESAMVGDSAHRDMKGAALMGMPHFWLCGDNNKEDFKLSYPKAIILNNLNELPNKLENLKTQITNRK